VTLRAHLLLGAVLAVAVSSASRADAVEPGDTSFEAGQQVSVLTDGQVSRNLSYATFHTKPIVSRDDKTGSTWELRLGARAFYDFETKISEVSIRDLAIVRRTDHVTATVGFQEIVWGETLGFPVADIVNPRDLRDPLFLDTDWVRLPVAAANVQYTGGPFRLQGLVTPIPRSAQLPDPGSPFLPQGIPVLPIPSFSVDRAGQDAEWGGRAGVLVSGWDFSASFLAHWSRAPVFQLVTLPLAPPVLEPVIHRVSSPGLSLTKTVGDEVVVRFDSVLNIGEPQQSAVFAPPALVLESQNVIDADLTSGDWLISLQYEYDRQGSLDRHWLTARVQKTFFDRRLELDGFMYRGLNNGDAWLQPMITWSFLDSLSISARADFVWGTPGDAGQLGYLNDKNRIFAILRARL
jgi:hypothetical protein